MRPLVSVIVPVYRVEEYLHPCVDSILHQTYTNLEVILVDDGSPDDCGAICDAYAAKDSRVKVIHKPNGGQADARNVGMAAMSGEYVTFVDSDDWLAADLYERVMAHAPFSAVLFGCTYVDGRTGEQKKNLPCDAPAELVWESGADCVEQLVKSSLFGYAWNKVFHRDVVAGLTFPQVLLREDLVFHMAAFARTEKIVLLDHAGYYYYQRSDSSLRKQYRGAVPDIAGAAEQMLTVHPALPEKANRQLSSCLIKQYILDMLYKYVFQNATLTEREQAAEVNRVLENRTLAKVLRYEKDESRLHWLLTLCMKTRMPNVFCQFVRGKWNG